jgi:methylmalonyl-CoA mutase
MIGLKENFPPLSIEKWLERLKKDLKSEDLHELNFYDEIEGIQITSYGHQELISSPTISPGQFPYTRGLVTESNKWKNGFFISVSDAVEANKKALEMLMNGVDALIFELDRTDIDLNILLNNIGLEHIHTTFIPKNLDQLRIILNGPVKIAKQHISVAIDLIEDSEFNTGQLELIQLLKENQLPVFLADGFKIQQCGANISQELAFILSCANEYLILLLNEGLSVDEAVACIHFKIGIGSIYFQEIAKIRALRFLWSNIVKQYKPEHSCSYNCRITAQTGSMNKSAVDPNTNLLRQTTEAMSALIGGVDQLIVMPFDAESKKGTSALAERMGVNISLILKEESYLHKVIDPAGGSYAIEDLTIKFSKKAWALFQSMDDNGGIFDKDCKDQFILEVKAIAEKRIQQIRSKGKTLIGVNKFQNPVPENNEFGNYGKYMGINMINFERDI